MAFSKGNNKRKTSKPANSKLGSLTKNAKPTEKNSPVRKPKVEKKPNLAPKTTKNPNEIRLNKYISNSGVCSRRDADIYIQSGNVKVNGIPIIEMGYMVKPGDVVNFDGVVLTPEKKEYVLLNKPKNFTTSTDEKERHVLELLKTINATNFAPVGRMDKNTTGLLVLSNDNDLIVKFNAPNQKSTKMYQVTLDKNLKFEDLEKISGGVTLDNHRLYVEEISYIENQPKTEIGIKLKTANVKVVRAIFENFQYNVLKIDRVLFAGLTKKNLPRGTWRYLTQQEIINLKNS